MKSKEEIDRLVRLELEKSDLSNKTQAQIDSYVSELYLMAGFMKDDNEIITYEPKVGLFFFDKEQNCMFGVVSVEIDSLIEGDSNNPIVSCGKSPVKEWERKKKIAFFQNDAQLIRLYSQDYSKVPRGQVCYNKAENKFIITVSRGDEIPNMVDVIVNTFELNESNYEISTSDDI